MSGALLEVVDLHLMFLFWFIVYFCILGADLMDGWVEFGPAAYRVGGFLVIFTARARTGL